MKKKRISMATIPEELETKVDEDIKVDDTKVDDPNEAARNEVAELQRNALLDRERENFRLRQQLNEANERANRAPEVKEVTKPFMEDPDARIAQLEAGMRRMLADAITPINQQMAQTKREADLTEIRRQIERVPALAKVYKKVGNEVDNLLRNATVLNEEVVMGAIRIAAGDYAIKGGKIDDDIPDDTKTTRKDNPTITESLRDLPAKKMNNRDKQIKDYIDTLTEADRRRLKSFDMTPEQAAVAVVDGLLDNEVQSLSDLDSVFAKKADK